MSLDALARDPDNVEAYQKLYQLQREKEAYDEAWCAAAALAFMRKADEETSRFFEDHRTKGVPVMRARLDDEQWIRNLMHEEEDRRVGKIFEMLAGAALKAQIGNLRAQSKLPELPPQFRQDPATSKVTLARTFGWAAQVLGIPCPQFYLRIDTPGMLSAVASEPPASVAGQTVVIAFSAYDQVFVVGKHLAMYRGEHYIKALFPTVTELTVLLFAGITLVASSVPSPPDLAAQIAFAATALRRHIQPRELEGLRDAVQKFLAEGGKVDLKRWMQAVEITACRAGLLLCGDLEIAKKVIAAEPPQPGDLAPAEKLKELVRFSVSERYHALRVALGIAVAVPAHLRLEGRAAKPSGGGGAMSADTVADALLALPWRCTLDEIEAGLGPLFLNLEAREQGPAWPSISWPEGAPAARPESAPLLGFVTTLSLSFDCDFHHYSPGGSADRLGSRPVGSWSALVRAPREVFERRLRAKHGAPRVVTKRTPRGGGTECHAYGDRLYLLDGPGGGFFLEYCTETPAYAVPDRDPSALRDFLAGLPTALASIRAPAELGAFAERVPTDTGTVIDRSSNLEDAAKGKELLSLEIKPPVDATLLAELWRLPEAFGTTPYVSQSTWYLTVPVPGDGYRRFAPPGFGRWGVEVTLEGWPEAQPGYAGEENGPSKAYDLRRAQAAVQRLAFSLRPESEIRQEEAPPAPLPPLKKGTQVRFVAGIHDGELGVVIGDQKGTRVAIDVDPQEDGLITHLYDRAMLVVEPRAPVSLGAMLHEVAYAFDCRGHSARTLFWWVARLPGGEGATDDALRVLHERYVAFSREVEDARKASFEPILTRFQETFGGFDDTARDAAWRRERRVWTESPGGAEASRELASSVGMVDEADPDRVLREAVLARAAELQTRAALAWLRRRPPPERSAVLEAAIEAKPDDPSVYLAYAEWLKERHDPRAELIGLQATGAESWHLSGFLRDHWAHLLGDLALRFPLRRGGLEWHLGFLSSAKVVVERADAERGVRAFEVVARLAAQPSGRFLRRLWLQGGRVTADDAAEVLAIDGLRLLRSVALVGVELSPDLCAMLVEPLRRRLLPILDLSRSKASERFAAALVAQAPHLQHLERLDLNPAGLEGATLARLRQALPMLSLERAEELAAIAGRRATGG